MKNKEGKIVFDGVEVATITHKDGELSIKCTKEGKEICKKLHEGCC